MGQITIELVGGSRPCAMKLELDAARPNEAILLRHVTNGQFYEPDIARVLLAVLREGDAVIDVGANAGFFTMMAGALVGERGVVASFEPDPDNLARLRHNVAISEFAHVTVIPAPASHSAREVTFYLNRDDSGGSALWDVGDFAANSASRAEPRPVAMRSTTLDAEVARLGLGGIKLLKIDAEGAEHDVLRGAAGLLAGCGVPFVVCELNDWALRKLGSSVAALRTHMEALGYGSYLLYYDGRLPRFVPPGTAIAMNFILNILFAEAGAIARHWPAYLHAAETV